MGVEVYFEGSFNFGKRTVLAGSVVLLIVAALVGYQSLEWLHEPEQEQIEWIGVIGGLLVALGVGCGAMWLLCGWLTHRHYRVQITSQGILDRKHFSAWSEIGGLSFFGDEGKYCLTYGRRGRPSFEHRLVVDEDLSAEQCEQVIRRVKDAIHTSHPHVRFD